MGRSRLHQRQAERATSLPPDRSKCPEARCRTRLQPIASSDPPTVSVRQMDSGKRGVLYSVHDSPILEQTPLIIGMLIRTLMLRAHRERAHALAGVRVIDR